MDTFLSTLHSIDVHLKRSIMGLAEANIIRLRAPGTAIPTAAPIPGMMPGGPSTGAPGAPGGGSGPPPTENPDHAASVYPTGSGTIGSRLDVGWLNARGARVEREMEGELWRRAREFLEGESAKGGASGLLGGGFAEEEGVDGEGVEQEEDDDDDGFDSDDDDDGSEDGSTDGGDSGVDVKVEDVQMHSVVTTPQPPVQS